MDGLVGELKREHRLQGRPQARTEGDQRTDDGGPAASDDTLRLYGAKSADLRSADED